MVATPTVYYKLYDLPLQVWKVAQRSRVVDEARALDVLQAAAASRLGGLVVGVQTYHEQLGGIVRAQLAEAEVRARMTERRASDAAVALDVASALVRDLRALAEDLPSLIGRRAVHVETEERDTVEMPPGATLPAPASRQRPLTAPPEPADEERVSGDEELTRVQSHPLPGAQTLASAGAPRGGGR